MFDSGPHVSCYRAFSVTDGSFVGVRCVKFANLIHCPELEGVAFVWYAEGTGPAGAYRHFGEAFNIPPAGANTATLIAHAAVIVGNGEQHEPFLQLQFEAPSPPAEVPARLIVAGDRREEWMLEPEGVVPEYQPLQRHIERTGPQLNEFTVRKHDGTPGFGVRSMLSSGSWLGAGRWLDRTYLHLGTYIGARTGPVRFGVSDIAARNTFCGFVPWGDLAIRAETQEGTALRRVTGAWSETWQLRHTATTWRPDPRITGLTEAD